MHWEWKEQTDLTALKTPLRWQKVFVRTFQYVKQHRRMKLGCKAEAFPSHKASGAACSEAAHSCPCPAGPAAQVLCFSQQQQDRDCHGKPWGCSSWWKAAPPPQCPCWFHQGEVRATWLPAPAAPRQLGGRKQTCLHFSFCDSTSGGIVCIQIRLVLDKEFN